MNETDRVTLTLTVGQCNAVLPYLAKGPWYRVAALMAAVQQAVFEASNGTAAVVPTRPNGGEMPDVPHRQ